MICAPLQRQRCSQTEKFATWPVSLVFKSISSRTASQPAPERENLISPLAREIFDLEGYRDVNLWAVERKLIKETVGALVAEIIIIIPVIGLGTDAVCNLAAQRAINLYSDVGSDAKPANMAFSKQIECFVQIESPSNRSLDRTNHHRKRNFDSTGSSDDLQSGWRVGLSID